MAKITFLILILTSYAKAENILPDPMTCGKSFTSKIEMFHRGAGRGGHKKTVLKFTKEGEFSYSSEYGDVTNETVDGPNLKNSWKVTGFKKVFGSQDQNLECHNPEHVDDCAGSIQNVLRHINVTDAKLMPGPNEKQERAALACARSISLSMISEVVKNAAFPQAFPKGGYKLKALTENEVLALNARLDAIQAKRQAARASSDARAAQTAAESAAAFSNTMNIVNGVIGGR